jgi:CDP-paratose 2-epimerase
MKLLVTGGCGFLGSNLAAHALQLGMDLCVLDNLSRTGSQSNLAWLRSQGPLFHFVHADIRNANDVDRCVAHFMPDAVFHLAGQVAMTTSIEDPRKDFEINAGGTFHVLEAVRRYRPHAPLIYSSTNKVYGDLEQYAYQENETRFLCTDKPQGFDEATPLSFHSPYGCSKGAADQYLLDYHRIHGLNTTVFRHSSMYGGRQFATADQGWVGWFCQKALEAEKGKGKQEAFGIAGKGKQVRDVLHAQDMIALYFQALEHTSKVAGQAFNIGGGMNNSLSLLELFSLLEQQIGQSLIFRQGPARISDQRVFVADTTKIQTAIGWSPQVDAPTGIAQMLAWCREAT